MYIFLVVFEYA